MIGNLIWFLDQCVRGYMDRKGWTGPRELCEIAEKHFASLMGSELARLPEEELQGKWADYSGGV